MAVGIQVFAASGAEFVTPDARCLKWLGVVNVRSDTNPSGMITDGNLLLGQRPDAWFIAASNYQYSPAIEFFGNVMSWSNPSGQFWAGRIIYGFW